MRKDWIWAGLLGLSVVACLDDLKKLDDKLDEAEDGGGGDGGGDGGGGGGGGGSRTNLEDLATSVCGMYDDCGLVEDYFGSMSNCINQVQAYYVSYGCEPGEDIDECIDEMDSQGCEYYYYGGSGACYYALECSGGYYYY